jgi:hypothetical protein
MILIFITTTVIIKVVKSLLLTLQDHVDEEDIKEMMSPVNPDRNPVVIVVKTFILFSFLIKVHRHHQQQQQRLLVQMLARR